MSLSDVIRNIAKTITDKEKAKELPLVVIQSTLSAAGQALLLVDRVKNSIKGLASKEEVEETSRPAAEQLAEGAQEKPARREPVIFAPRPSATGAAEPNGTAPKAKVEPVIFTPATKPDPTPEPPTPAATETAPAGPAAPEAASAGPATAEAKPAATTASEVAAAPESVEVKPVVVEEPAAETPAAKKAPAKEAVAKEAVIEAAVVESAEPVAPVAEPAEPVAAKAKPAAKRATAKPKTATPAPAADTAAAEAPVKKPARKAPARTTTAKPAAAKAAGEAGAVLAEPLVGYGELTVASLRARMRGKSAAQIGELLDYERATQGRPEVVKMYENRLAKLEAGE
ncbi:hypothetical protein ACIBEJ_31725 [Nonomuraea sp. NPDC050790]|uniref:hypothetical protein n=1 Tax=Nonomuraea sp. NPDC050790 TaxID=3364371 RepID=UPI00378C40BF